MTHLDREFEFVTAMVIEHCPQYVPDVQRMRTLRIDLVQPQAVAMAEFLWYTLVCQINLIVGFAAMEAVGGYAALGPGVVRVHRRRVAEHIASSTDTYTVCYAGGDVHPIRYTEDLGEAYVDLIDEEWVYFTEDCAFAYYACIAENFDRYIDLVRDVEADPLNMPMTLVDGVAGCGKTTEICTDVAIPLDFICVTTRAGRNEFKIRLADSAPALWLERRVRTVGSVVISNTFDIMAANSALYIDEALASHKGELLLAIAMLRPHAVIMHGDRAQCPWASRAGPSYEFMSSDFTEGELEVTYRDHSWRLPANFQPILRALYPGRPVTCGKENGPMGIVTVVRTSTPLVAAAEYVKANPEALVMSFGRKDAGTLSRELSIRAKTTNAAQGSDTGHAAVVRLRPGASWIYESMPHILVGATRHKASITYITPVRDDFVQLLEKCITPPSARPAAVVGRQPHIRLSTRVPVIGTRGTSTRVLSNEDRALGVVDLAVINFTFGEGFSMPRVTREVYLSPTPELDSVPSMTLDFPMMRDLLTFHFGERDVIAVATEEWCKFDGLLRAPPKGVIILESRLPTDGAPIVEEQTSLLHRLAPTNVHWRDVAAVFCSVQKRIIAPPGVTTGSNLAYVGVVWNRILSCFDPDKIALVRQHFSTMDSRHVADYLHGRSAAALGRLEDVTQFFSSGTVWHAFAKPAQKSSFEKISSGKTSQMVTTPAAHHTLLHGLGFRCLSEVMAFCLKPQILICNGITKNEVMGSMDQFVPSSFYTEETDIPTYDASQDALAVAIVARFLQHIGFSHVLIESWVRSHAASNIILDNIGLSVRASTGNRSGGAGTFCRNTLLKLAVVTMMYRIDKASLTLIAGDDFLGFFATLVESMPQMSEDVLAQLFNLSIKREAFTGSIYFCSKFVLDLAIGFIWVADPMKVMLKLGRTDIRSKEHIEFYYASYADNLLEYSWAEVRHPLAMACADRYARACDNPIIWMAIIEYIALLREDKDKFFGLFMRDELPDFEVGTHPEEMTRYSFRYTDVEQWEFL